MNVESIKAIRDGIITLTGLIGVITIEYRALSLGIDGNYLMVSFVAIGAILGVPIGSYLKGRERL